MYTYTLQATWSGYSLVRSDGATVPSDFGNTDYQAFLRWLQEGNELPGLPVPMGM
jgi:hypothetical protein